MATILVLHGPNLNLLGSREPETYGSVTLDQINQSLASLAEAEGHSVQALQSNSEAELINAVHNSDSDVDFILLNPAGLTHTSVALRDALLAIDMPFIEVHLSNIHAREEFRKHSYFSDIAEGVITGLGARGYELALIAAMDQLDRAR